VFAQDLASRGYIVMALSDQVADAPLDFSSEAASRVTQGRGDRYVRRAATQISTILDDLLDGQDAGRLTATGGIDRTRIGICGFSFGGAVAAESTRADPRLRAAANLDGWMFGEAAAEGVPKPYIIIGTGMRPPLAEEIPRFERRFDAVNEQQILAGLGRHGGYYLSVDGTTHFSFTDAPLLPSLRSLRATTPLGARRLRGIIATYVGQFFDRYVGGAKAPLFDTPVAHVPVDPAVHVKTWRAPVAPLLITDSRDERS
jgi:predicted dienelactone hydrolase